MRQHQGERLRAEYEAHKLRTRQDRWSPVFTVFADLLVYAVVVGLLVWAGVRAGLA